MGADTYIHKLSGVQKGNADALKPAIYSCMKPPAFLFTYEDPQKLLIISSAGVFSAWEAELKLEIEFFYREFCTLS